MNHGKLNHRIRFIQESHAQDGYGGTIPEYAEILQTWGSLEPVRQYNQQAIEAGANVFNEDKILVIRFRQSFTPDRSMLFTDVNDPLQAIYTIKSISPYYPGAKTTFENTSDKVYQDKWYVYIVGVKTPNSYINGIFS